jgi:hypothetical protein
MSDAERQCHRVYLQAEAADRDQKRTFVPVHNDEVIFRASMTPGEAPTRRASDYGHQAFPMLVRGERRRDKREASAFALNAEPLNPIRSERRLKYGFAAGDTVLHHLFGVGLILSIAPQETIFQYNSGLRSAPTRNAHLNLSLVKKG